MLEFEVVKQFERSQACVQAVLGHLVWKCLSYRSRSCRIRIYEVDGGLKFLLCRRNFIYSVALNLDTSWMTMWLERITSLARRKK